MPTHCPHCSLRLLQLATGPLTGAVALCILCRQCLATQARPLPDPAPEEPEEVPTP